MTKKKFDPAPALMLQIEQAFITQGYGALTMRAIAKACDFSTRALYFYFSNKQETFRAVVRFRNELALSTGFEAGRKRREAGGDALDILSDIINIRYGDTRRMANASPHLIELNAQVFTFCTDIVTEVALIFEAELAKLIVELEDASLLRLRPGFTAEQLAQALANGARGVNQRLPPVQPKDLAKRYREMCGFILRGSADIADRASRPVRRRPARSKAKQARD
jgi:AcrR family transcriptional regulator